MRKDMDKVVYERGRSKGCPQKGRRKATQKDMANLEDTPKVDKNRRDWDTGKNSLYSMRPLKRLFVSRVGERWDKVYSEICQVFKDKNYLLRIRSYIPWYITLRVKMIDGVPYNDDLAIKRWPRGQHPVRTETYVHPETGIVCLTPRPKKRLRPKKNWIYAGGGRVYTRVNGFWSECWLADFDPPTTEKRYITPNKMYLYVKIGDKKFDTLLHREVTDGSSLLLKTYGRNQYCYKYRDLNAKEVKKLLAKRKS